MNAFYDKILQQLLNNIKNIINSGKDPFTKYFSIEDFITEEFLQENINNYFEERKKISECLEIFKNNGYIKFIVLDNSTFKVLPFIKNLLE